MKEFLFFIHLVWWLGWVVRGKESKRLAQECYVMLRAIQSLSPTYFVISHLFDDINSLLRIQDQSLRRQNGRQV
jgi:hypothetical protein